MFRKSFQALFLLVFNSLILCGQTTNPYKSVKIDTTRIVSSSEVVKIAQRFLKRHLNLPTTYSDL